MSDNNNNAQDQESPITEPLTSTATTTATTAMNQDTKVLIILKPVGDAPLLKKTKYKIAATSQFSEVIVFVRKRLNVQPDQSLFLYCNQAFCPSPSEYVGNLLLNFGKDKLVLNYALTTAWG